MVRKQFEMYSDENIRKRIWLIADGIPLMLDNITIRTNDAGKLLVTGWTSAIDVNNFSKDDIIHELDDLKSTFSDLSKSFPELNDVVKENDLTIEYQMAFDDYGKTGIGLCSEIEGKLNWYVD